MDDIRNLIIVARAQWRNVWRSLFLLYLPILLLFIGVGILSRMVEGASLQFFLRDIVATGELPFFAGFVSQVEAILWSASLAVCLLSLLLFQHLRIDRPESRRLLLQGGILTGLLLIDDIFLSHEEIAPKYLHIGENFIVAIYLAMGLVFVLSNPDEILSSDFRVLFRALTMFDLSKLLDALPIDDFDLRYFWKQLELFLEDGFKFAGIATWLLYFIRYSAREVGATRGSPLPSQLT